MANFRLVGLFLTCIFAVLSFAEEYETGYNAATEVDTEYCTRSTANMIDYCMGYCEKYGETSCTSATPTYSGEDWQVIDQCVCTCGVEQETLTYDDVPCGENLMRLGSPGANYNYDDYGGSGNVCCLAGLVLAAIGLFSMRR